jgi:hypothetical protein
MRFMPGLIGAVLCSVMVSSADAAPGRRCGWLMNPTPMNVWLDDADGSWTLSLMGGQEADGIEVFHNAKGRWMSMPAGSPSARFACGCITGETEKRADGSTWFKRIATVSLLSPTVCNKDPKLPKRDT